MVVEVGVGAPVRGPSRCGPAPPCPRTSSPSKSAASVARPSRERLADDDRVEVGERFQWQFGQIGAVGIAVERAVDIGAGVGDHVDAADLEARPVVIMRAPTPRGSSNRTGAGRGSP